MTFASNRGTSLRRRLFGSHVIVMIVALVVLALVVSVAQLVGEGRAFEVGRRDSGSTVVFFGLAAAVIASAIVSWRITRRLARPLEEIGAATRELAAGRYDIRLPGSDTVELDDLASDVNQLATELETTEQRRLQLIGDVAHELRNPLSTIEGTMEALLDGVMPADDDTYSRIGREAARLRRLAEDLSSLSAAGELSDIDHHEVDLMVIAADAVAQLDPQAAAKGLTIAFEAGRLPMVRGDGDRLTQVLMNVVGNAVQYTDEGRVVVQLTTDEQSVLIDVIDTGRGLAAEDHLRIFDRFHRVDDHFTDGTGVGLAIAKLIVEAHGGRIAAESTGLGRGTKVRITLPLIHPTRRDG